MAGDADDLRRRLDDLDEGLAPPPPTRSLDDLLELELVSTDPAIDDLPRHTMVPMVLAIGTVLLMMAVGAAAALLLFQDRLAQLFR